VKIVSLCKRYTIQANHEAMNTRETVRLVEKVLSPCFPIPLIIPFPEFPVTCQSQGFSASTTPATCSYILFNRVSFHQILFKQLAVVINSWAIARLFIRILPSSSSVLLLLRPSAAVYHCLHISIHGNS